MNAEILAVGTELLMGQIVNSNARYISRRLADVGVNVFYHDVVGDNPGRLKECLSIALKRSDAVLMTGGLGPTQDDLTKETVSDIFEKKLVLDNQSAKKIESFFKSLNRSMTESNYKQAYFPEGCIVMENNVGTAPGCYLEADGKVVFMLPGPPVEMEPMFEKYVIPYFTQRSTSQLVSKYVKVFGKGESSVEKLIMDLIDKQSNPTIAPYASAGNVTLRVTAKCEKGENPDRIMGPVLNGLKEKLGDYVYTIEDESMEEVTARLLMDNDITLALAESCTGGKLSMMLTDIPGISKVFNRAVVCYSNQSKVEDLGVRPETMKKHGAVSRQTALEMANGIKKKSNADIGLSITGVAGPGEGTPKKPVGLVYIGFVSNYVQECRELNLRGGRSRVRYVSCLHALDMIRRCVLKQVNS